MRPDIIFVREKVSYYNALIFNDVLPEISLEICNTGNSLGMFCFPKINCRPSARDLSQCKLRISNRYDLPEDEICDTIIHELIHFYIWYEGLKDSRTHGPLFISYMNDINKRFGRNVTVRHNRSEETMNGDRRISYHYLCVTLWDDGLYRITDCARTCIFDIHQAFSTYSRVRELRWYVSKDTWFNRFRRSRTPKAYHVSQEQLLSHLSKALPCRCSDGVFQPL